MVELSDASPLDYIRFIGSTILLLFSTVVTSYAIWENHTHFWNSVPGYVALIIFVIVLFCLGVVEGLQIALVELKRQHPNSYQKSHPKAYYLGQLAAKSDNVERFLMGRQVFVVFLVFFSAKLTTIDLKPGDDFLFPVPSWVNVAFFQTGILACIIVVNIAQLMPQIVAAKYPVHFLEFFIMRPAYFCCIFVEATGLTHVTWLMSDAICRICRFKDDTTTINPKNINPEVTLNNIEKDLEIVTKVPSRKSSISATSDKKFFENISIDYEGQETSFTKLVKKLNTEVDPDTLTLVRHFLDSHPEKFHQFPSVVGGHMYPSPQAVAEAIKDAGKQVPRFLTDISDPEHIPPHIVASELMALNNILLEEIETLKRKLNNDIHIKL